MSLWQYCCLFRKLRSLVHCEETPHKGGDALGGGWYCAGTPGHTHLPS